MKYEKDSYRLFGIVDGDGYTDYNETVLKFFTCNNKRDILEAVRTVKLILSGELIKGEWLENVRNDIINEYERYKDDNIKRNLILSSLLGGSDYENKIPIGDYETIKSVGIEEIMQFFISNTILKKYQSVS